MSEEDQEDQQENRVRNIPYDYYKNRDLIITEKALQGCSTDDIVAQTGFKKPMVLAILRKYSLFKHVKERNQEIKEEILADKVPILKEIAQRSLSLLNEWLIETANNPELRAARVNTVQDVKGLSNITKELNEMLRLELGQSTQNVAHVVEYSLEQTKQIFHELKEIDPVFEYPQIDYVEADTDTGTISKA